MSKSAQIATPRIALISGLCASLLFAAGCTTAGGTAQPGATASSAPATSSSSASSPAATPPTSPSPSVGTPIPSSSSDATEAKALDQLEKQVAKDSGLETKSSEPDYSNYVRVEFEGGKLAFEVPSEWDKQDRGGMLIDRAPDMKKFDTQYGTGVEIVRFTTGSADAILESHRQKVYVGHCTPGPVRSYDDGRLAGKMQTFSKCDGDGTSVVLAVTSTGDGETFRGYFDSAFVDTRDVAALKRIVSSLDYQAL